MRKNHLTAVGPANVSGVPVTPYLERWLFKCDCGKSVETRVYNFIYDKKDSCGCKRAGPRTHGGASYFKLTPEYRAWRCMLTRAKNPNIESAEYYAGIGVCPEWDSGGDGRGYDRFLAHVGPKPSPSLSLDRIKSDRSYEPGNVRWATSREQNLNKRDVHLVEYHGEKVPLLLLAEKFGINPTTVKSRLYKFGWPIEKALSTPPQKSRCVA